MDNSAPRRGYPQDGASYPHPRTAPRQPLTCAPAAERGSIPDGGTEGAVADGAGRDPERTDPPALRCGNLFLSRALSPVGWAP
ncbi:hypothetical protein GCM10009760_10620 [Kitasatospora kazusensis]|uniref:Uncharacterized protein n=1 Tax=Kitasatospora kazusensis TaxID=407974 RepID=A0ABN2YXH2_9ACTN